MLRIVLSSSRFVILIPVIGTLVAAVGLLLYETTIVLIATWAAVRQFAGLQRDAKALAWG
jgi:uncharacterized membrane protein YqhA